MPTAFEAFVLDSVAGKAFFCTFQIFFYALRPMFVYKLPVTTIQLINIAVQVVFDYFLVTIGSWRSLVYLLLSSFLAGSLHPCAGHFIAEHYVFANSANIAAGGKDGSSKERKLTPHDPSVPLPETFSYYGPLNWFTYNVGLHNEHHDFPAIPWTRLPELHRIANEFYKDLPYHKSWVAVLWQFVLDDGVGLWCRVRRKEGGRLVGGGWKEEELGANEKSGLKREGVR
jgi:sphingolipid 4-desaturase/C4-monooxygenase